MALSGRSRCVGECPLSGEERTRAWRFSTSVLLASFPNANPGNSEAYVGMMVEDVMAEDHVSLVVLESACSQIRRTSKFPPTTAEVIEAIREQAELWEPRLDAVYFCEDVVGRLRYELKAATELVAAATAERQEQRRIAAEKQRADLERMIPGDPFAIGDRVAHAKFGVGTVESVDDNKITVMFDAAGCKKVVASFLERAE